MYFRHSCALIIKRVSLSIPPKANPTPLGKILASLKMIQGNHKLESPKRATFKEKRVVLTCTKRQAEVETVLKTRPPILTYAAVGRGLLPAPGGV